MRFALARRPAGRISRRTAAYFAGQVTTGSGACWFQRFLIQYMFRVAGLADDGQSFTSDSHVNSRPVYARAVHASLY
jgi:hypothetical protein